MILLPDGQSAPPPEKTLLIIFGYGKQDEMLERHRPFFDRAECEIMLVSPADDPFSHPSITYGFSQYTGDSVILRHIYALEYAMRLPFDNFFCVEADSVVLKPIPVHPKNGMNTVVYQNADRSFKSPFYCHCPWWFDRETLDKWVWTAKVVGPSHEKGFADRYMGYVAWQAGINVVDRKDVFYSRNRIDSDTYRQEAREAINNGHIHLHGLKTLEDLQSIGL